MNSLSPLPMHADLALMQAHQGSATDRAMQAALKASQAQGAEENGTAITAPQMEKFDKTAQDFEAMFVSEMMKPMFEGLSTDGLFGGGKGEEVFRGMMLGEYGKLIAKTGTIGMSDSIKDAMIQMQADANTQN